MADRIAHTPACDAPLHAAPSRAPFAGCHPACRPGIRTAAAPGR
ncbi:hypothetical protein ROS9278_03863 [Roseomonas sp. CECT 9278]|nr:hypothetical protein ROS9278_03863 [Roseomonas sp. CECT 9278]